MKLLSNAIVWFAAVGTPGVGLGAGIHAVEQALERVPAGATDLVPRAGSPAADTLRLTGTLAEADAFTTSRLEFTAEMSRPVNFHRPFEQTFKGRVELREAGGAENAGVEGAAFSRNRVYWFRVEALDAKTTEIKITVANQRAVRVLALKDSYLNFPPEVKWVNEKLLFIRVWWGRVLGTDYLYDVETGRIIYEEMVHDGALLLQQTREAGED